MRYDAVICGAGTSGAVAAIAAADEGLRVALIEQSGAAGGSATLSLVTPQMHTGIEGNPGCSYVGLEIDKRMRELGAASADGRAFDPLVLGLVLEEMLEGRGVRLMLHRAVTGARMSGRRVLSVEARGKSGAETVEGARFVDATGDADLCAALSLTVMHGDEATGKNQPVSLRYILGGVDLDAFWRFLCASRGHDAPRPDMVEGSVTLGGRRTEAQAPFIAAFEAAIAAGELTEEDGLYWQFFTIPGRCDAVAFNCPEFFDVPNALDADALSGVQVRGKRAILRQLAFYRKRFPGFQRAYIAEIARMVGVRESRRATTDYIVTADDLVSRKTFPDAILCSNYPVDVHGKKLRLQHFERREGEKPYFEVPFRSLVAREADNLLVAGRCLGAEFVAQSAIRIIPSCRAMGEACGVACAMDKGDFHALDGALVRARMIEKGAIFA